MGKKEQEMEMGFMTIKPSRFSRAIMAWARSRERASGTSTASTRGRRSRFRGFSLPPTN